jgi:hypothetical protein
MMQLRVAANALCEAIPHVACRKSPLTGSIPGGIVAPNMNLSFMRTNDMNTTTTLRHEGVGRGSAIKLR